MSTIDTVQELINWTPPYTANIIEEGILKAGTSMIIFGEAKSWKSITALHTANCIATGKEWFGYKTTRAIAFKYQSELPKAIDRERTIKYMNSHRPAGLLLKTNPYISLDSSYGKTSLDKDIDLVSHQYPNQHIVLILDPLYLMLSGHVSDEYEVKKLLQNLNDLRTKFNMSVIIVHHSHKTRIDNSGNIVDTGSEEIIDSSYLNNWADTMVRLKLLNPKSGKDKVEFSFGLVRHATKPLQSFHVKWDRTNLHPTVYHVDPLEDDEITVKGLV